MSLALIGVGATAVAAHGGGMIGQGPPARIHQEVVEIFGDEVGFSATAVLTTTKTSGEFVQRFGYRLRRGVLRLDYTTDDNPFLTEQQKRSRRERGADTWYQIVTRDRSLLVFPERKVYAIVSDDEATPQHIEHTTLRPAPLKGRECARDRVVIGGHGGTVDVIVWRPADDPSAIPLRIESEHGESTTRLEFENVTRAMPDASLFEAPNGFRSYPNMSELNEALR
jgi:hypothetical protein